MSSQPNEKAQEIPEALVNELLRSQGLPLDAHVNVHVHTTRVRVNPDGTRTIVSDAGMSGTQRARSRRRPSAWAAVLFSIIGFGQLAYGMWASHSDALAFPLLRGSGSCQFTQVLPRQAAEAATVTLQAATTTPSVLAACRLEKAVIVERYATSSRNVTHYHIVTVTPTGRRDDIALASRTGSQLWERVRPTERLTLQRFVLPGYHLTGEVIALGDTIGATLTRWHPDANYRNNLVNVVMGGVLFVTGLALFVKSRAGT